VEAGQDLSAAVASGGTVVLAAGVHAGPLVFGASVTLQGEPGAVIDADGRGPCLLVGSDDLTVRIEGVELRAGHAEAGGGLTVLAYSDVTLVGCTLRGNTARGSGGTGLGGGVYAVRGNVLLDTCTFERNVARTGSDLVASGLAEVRVRGGSFSGDLAAREGATLLLEDARIAGSVHARGTTTRAPTVRLRGCTVRGGVVNDPSLPAVVSEDE
jgi:nitrous oxidase accessory protein NosD